MRLNDTVSRHVAHVIDVIEGDTPVGNNAGTERLKKSWQRSLNNHQVDPAQTNTPRIVTSRELREHKERLDAFMRIAREGVDRLHSQVIDSNYCVLMTDAEGITIDFRTVPCLEREFREEGFRIGTCWSEDREGTCGVGTSLVDHKPTLVHRGEHFRTHNINFTCSSAPIFGIDGQPIALLDASALDSPEQRDSQMLVYRMVIERAQQIENAYAYYSFRPYWVLQCGRLAEYLSVQTDYLIAFDDNGCVMGGNRRANLELLYRHGESPVYVHDLFECTAYDILSSAHARPGQPFPLRLQGTGERIFVTLHAPAKGHRIGDRRAKPCTEKSTDFEKIPGFRHLALNDSRVQSNVVRALKIVNRKIPAMLLGETGTGKEAFARALHECSERREKPFVALNCAAIPENLIESELFGYRGGAFTGANSKGATGKIVQSAGGTLFLDEIGDMPLQLQSRLLRVLAEGEVLPVGAEKSIPVDLNIVCATHQDLPDLVKQGRFREDLYYRLNGAVFLLPPLRERSDIGEVIDKVLCEEAAAMEKAELTLDIYSRKALENHQWPGNIRQLRYAMRYACAIAEGNTLCMEDFPPDLFSVSGLNEDASQKGTRAIYEMTDATVETNEQVPNGLSDSEIQLRAKMIETLCRNKWQVKLSAQELDMSRATFYRKLTRFRIVAPNKR